MSRKEGNQTPSGNTKLSQHDRFVETARALGCDEDEAAFDERLKAIARQKPKAKPDTKQRTKP